MTGPLPALISSVKIVSITSSFSARPPHVACGRPSISRLLDLEIRPVRGIRLGHVDDQVVGENELRQGCVPSSYVQSGLPSRPSQKRRFAFSRAR